MTLSVTVRAGQTLHEALRDLELESVLDIQYHEELEAYVLNGIRGVLEPTENQSVKIMSPSGMSYLLGISHIINPAAGDETGAYTFVLE